MPHTFVILFVILDWHAGASSADIRRFDRTIGLSRQSTRQNSAPQRAVGRSSSWGRQRSLIGAYIAAGRALLSFRKDPVFSKVRFCGKLAN